MVRTPGSHPGNPGSNPGRVTKIVLSPCQTAVLVLKMALNLMKIMPELTEPIPQEPYNSESITSQADVLTDQSIPETPKPENSSVNSILSRRQFLRLAGGAAAATVLASAAGPVVASRAITSLLDPTSSIS